MFSSAFLAVALFAATHAGAQPTTAGGRLKKERFKGRDVVAGQVLVKFSNTAGPQDVERAKGAADVESERKVGGKGVRLLQSRSKDAETLVRELSARNDVVYAEPNYIVRVSAVPDDPRFGEQWSLQNTGYAASTGHGTAGADIGVVPAWDISTGSRANVVAVVDTGVDYNHPDLAANVWSAPAAFTVNLAGQSITCPAGSHGFDALTNTCDPMDDYNHGTHVAGTVGAVGNNGVGVSGVSQTASIMGLRFIDAQGNGTLEGAINAIEFAIQAKQIFGTAANVRVLSNSWGWSGEASQALLDQINRAAASDMLFVAGAGNSAADDDVTPFYPASYDAASVVSVAATDNNDQLANTASWGSNYGRTSVDLAAPGNLILSTIIGGSYDWFSGTSMATPQVSGAAALVLSRCALDTAGLKAALLGNVDSVAALSAVTVTGGRLNVGKALSSCAATTTPTPTPTPAPTPTATPTPSPTPSPAAQAAGAGTASRLAKWLDGAGTLGDSVVTEAGGKVGLGVAAPGDYLDIAGPSDQSGRTGIRVRTTSPAGNSTFYFDNDRGNYSSYGGLLTSGSQNAFSFFGVSRADRTFLIADGATSRGLGVGTLTAQPLLLGTNNAERVRIDASGNVGVGTSNPQSALQVNGYLQLALVSGLPPAADCDQAAEYGRMKVDAVSVKLYVCTAAGWKSSALQ
ncbi:MAG TPA: S8 family peptidase [Pyrinomonadaceae bacterium]